MEATATEIAEIGIEMHAKISACYELVLGPMRQDLAWEKMRVVKLQGEVAKLTNQNNGLIEKMSNDLLAPDNLEKELTTLKQENIELKRSNKAQMGSTSWHKGEYVRLTKRVGILEKVIADAGVTLPGDYQFRQGEAKTDTAPHPRVKRKYQKKNDN